MPLDTPLTIARTKIRNAADSFQPEKKGERVAGERERETEGRQVNRGGGRGEEKEGKKEGEK